LIVTVTRCQGRSSGTISSSRSLEEFPTPEERNGGQDLISDSQNVLKIYEISLYKSICIYHKITSSDRVPARKLAIFS